MNHALTPDKFVILKRKMQTFRTLLITFGLLAALEYVLTKIILQPWFPMKELTKRRKIYRSVPGIRYPVCTRWETSDEEMFAQCFDGGEYTSLASLHPTWIIDCGGYIGLSTVWFLNKFPDTRVIIIEPDPDNFTILKTNVLPYGDRVIAINAAVWDTETVLTLEKGSFGDGKDWANQTKPQSTAGGPSVPTVTVSGMIAKYALTQIDILKIDIERAEIQLFSQHTEWLKLVKNIAIELHDDECKKVFFDAMKPYVFELQQSGDLTLCLKITKLPS